MGDFFAELKRRQMFRVAAAYAVVAWVLLQLFNNVAPILESPPWVARTVLLLLALGFPAALVFAWMREFAPAVDAEARATTGKLDWLLIGALIAVLAGVSYQQLAPSTDMRTAQQAGVAPGAANAAGISIAVLPFVNLSGDAGQEFFSDGMTEEITSAIARIPDLIVIGRTSAFQYKGRNEDLRTIGQALSASYLIEGSVRKAGDRVRITAQLIRADSGAHLWTESYDRLLTDVFATQEDIAQAIARALRVPLGLQQGERLVSNRTTDLDLGCVKTHPASAATQHSNPQGPSLESSLRNRHLARINLAPRTTQETFSHNQDLYQEYLRARALYRGRDDDQAIAVLEGAVVRDPRYSPAWGLLAQVYVQAAVEEAVGGLNADSVRLAQSQYFDKAENAAQEALRLDSQNANAYGALADIQYRRGNWAAAEDIYRQALARDPNEPDVLNRFGTWLAAVGRNRESLAVQQKILAQEPLVQNYKTSVANAMQRLGRYESSIPILESVPVVEGGISAMLHSLAPMRWKDALTKRRIRFLLQWVLRTGKR